MCLFCPICTKQSNTGSHCRRQSQVVGKSPPSVAPKPSRPTCSASWEQPAGHVRPVTVWCQPRGRPARRQCQTLATLRDAFQRAAPPLTLVTRRIRIAECGSSECKTSCDNQSRSEEHINAYTESFVEITQELCDAPRLPATSYDHLRPSRQNRNFPQFSAISDLNS
jgi:hypothetical protein